MKTPAKIGRPSEYKPQYCNEIIAFFQVPLTRSVLAKEVTKVNGTIEREYREVGNFLPHLVDFAHKVGVTHATLIGWSKKFPEFFEAYKEVNKLRERMIEMNTLSGFYNPSFAIFDAKNTLGWRDEQHLKVDSKEKIIIELDKGTTPKPGNRINEMLSNIE